MSFRDHQLGLDDFPSEFRTHSDQYLQIKASPEDEPFPGVLKLQEAPMRNASFIQAECVRVSSAAPWLKNKG